MPEYLMASDYGPEFTQKALRTCVRVAQAAGTMLDHIVVVGGLVPSFLVPGAAVPEGEPPHSGTIDVDIGLELVSAVDLDRLAGNLERAGFQQEAEDSERWTDRATGVTLDLLIPSAGQTRRVGASLAIPVRGLELAFVDWMQVALPAPDGRGVLQVRVCGPGALVLLKALAFADRRAGKASKDAYDLAFVLRYFENGGGQIAQCIRPLLGMKPAQEALVVLERDFSHSNAAGPKAVAEFELAGDSPELRADVSGAVRLLLDSVQP